MHATGSDKNYAIQGIYQRSVKDFSGVTFTAALFAEVRGAAGSLVGAAGSLLGPGEFQDAVFEDAVFTSDVDFSGFTFRGDTSFSGARFEGEADFSTVRFRGRVSFAGAVFEKDCRFDGSTFPYNGAAYASGEPVPGARSADFTRAVWRGRASFEGIWAAQDWELSRARFEESLVGEGRCEGVLRLAGAVLKEDVRLTFDAGQLDLESAKFGGSLELRLSNALVRLDHAELGARASVIHHGGSPATPPDHPANGSRPHKLPRLAGLRHVDAAQLMLIKVDLSNCRFADAHHLDLLVRTDCKYDDRRRWRRFLGVVPVRCVRRPVLADEGPGGPGPSAVAVLYRQLRKGMEDGKNEPGAGGFYYGEMEMRRNRKADETTVTERWLLHVYWLLSGYGLRAMRALGWLLAAVVATITLMMALGLPDAEPQQTVAGSLPTAGQVELKVRVPDPELTIPLNRRFTEKRANAALKVVLNSVVFRSSGQNLTPWGTYTEMVSRFTEPLLLALAALAVRGRVKRS
jgi:uncharacterized protein YjbI with pentapeptide repeats